MTDSAPPAVTSNADLVFRPAKPADVPAMLVVSDSAQKWLVDSGLADASDKPPTEARMSWFAKKAEDATDWSTASGRLFVAEKNGQIVGWCMASLGYPPHLPETDLNQIYLSGIYIHADHMKQGITRALIQFLVKEAADDMIQVIRAECKKGKLVGYHESWGFKPVEYTGDIPDYPDRYQLFELETPAAEAKKD